MPNSNEDQPYAYETPLTSLFGAGERTRVLAALLSETDSTLSVDEISHLSGVGQSMTERILANLTALGVVVDEPAGFKLNKSNPVAKKIAELEWEVIDFYGNDKRREALADMVRSKREQGEFIDVTDEFAEDEQS